MSEENEPVVDDTPKDDAPADTPKDDPKPDVKADAPKDDAPKDEPKDEPKDDLPQSPWADNWQEEVARSLAGDDEKAFEKHKKNLSQFYKEPTDMYRRLREQDEYIRGGGLVKVPGKDASEDEVAAYHKAIGVPESPDDYIEKIELSDGVQMGDKDIAVAKEFAQSFHAAGMTQAQVNMVIDRYFQANTQQETAMVEMDEADKQQADKALQEAYGPRKKAVQTAILNSFNGDTELHDKLMDGRLSDGTLIKHSPDVIAYLQGQAFKANPTAVAIVEGQANGVTVDEEIKEIEKLMRTDRRAYNKDEKKQARYRELLEIQQGMRA